MNSMLTLFTFCTICVCIMMRYLATAAVLASALSWGSSEAPVCVCARFSGIFFWFWVCMDTNSGQSGVQPSAGDNGVENDGFPQIVVDTTLALIKPDAVDRSEEIVDIILRSGFSVLRRRRVSLTPEQASEFYAEHIGKPFFPSLVSYMSSGPVLALVLAREKAVTCWRELIGPTNAIKARETHPDSLRAVFGTDDERNGLHGSDSSTSAEREMRFFFPDATVEPITVGQAARDYLSQVVNPTLLKGLTELCKQKPQQPVVWLADWLINNNPNKPTVMSANVEEP